MPTKTVNPHIDATQFEEHIRNRLKGCNCLSPIFEHILTFVGTNTQGPTKMIEDDSRIRETPGQFDKFR